jgi:RecA-family ATPase
MDPKEIFKMDALDVDEWQKKVDGVPSSPDLIQELLAPQQVMVAVGRHGIGKTNDLLHLFHKFEYGGDYHGLKVMPCPVLYVLWEGDPLKINKRLDLINVRYAANGNKLCPGYFKMKTTKMALNTDAGRNELKSMVGKLNPRPTVVILDPFKRTINGDYSKPPIADSWIQGVVALARDENTAIIASAHTNKITYRKSEAEDTLGADKVKGAGDLLDGVSSAIMIAEEVGSKREKVTDPIKGEFSVVRWATLSILIKVLKARDAISDFPLLRVKFDHDKLRFVGQEWVVNKDGTIIAEDEI